MVVLIWASFGFRFSALTSENRSDAASSKLALGLSYLRITRPAERTIVFAPRLSSLPEAYLYGLVYIEQTSDSRPAYLDNQWSIVGFRSFFPRAFIYKTPLPVLCLLSLSLPVAGVRWKNKWRGPSGALSQIIWRDCEKLTPILTLVVVYGAFALTGEDRHRASLYFFPIYPAIFIACGSSVYLFGISEHGWPSLLSPSSLAGRSPNLSP